MKTNRLVIFGLFPIVIFISAISTVLLLFDANKPQYYSILFLLPLTFAILSVLFRRIYFSIPINIGISLVYALFFVRMVLSPLFLYLGGYPIVIAQGADTSLAYSILLICYEALMVFLVMYFHVVKHKKEVVVVKNNMQSINLKYSFFVFLILAIIVLVVSIIPEFLDSYRTIFEINDKHFTSVEDSYVVSKYGTSFVTKLALVMGTYLMRIAIVLFPAFIIVILSHRRHNIINKILSFLACLIPLFFIPGAIAMSLIYVLCLMFLRLYLYPSEHGNTSIMIVLVLGACAVLAWWIFRAGINDLNIVSYLSKNLMTYFSGADVVSGVFNLPKDIEYRFTYFAYDYLDSIPFGSTFFKLSQKPVHEFFNNYNNTMGQIPPTIGMGYYYFGLFLSPIYSIIFAYIAFISAEKIAKTSNPFARLRLLITTIYFSMGIIMYNIEITFTTLFSLILPMYILERLAFKNEKHS